VLSLETGGDHEQKERAILALADYAATCGK